MKRKPTTPAGTARAEDPGLSVAREAAEAVPAESVRLKRKSTLLGYVGYKLYFEIHSNDKKQGGEVLWKRE